MAKPSRETVWRTLTCAVLLFTLTSCAARQVKQEPEPVRPVTQYVKPDVEYPAKEVYDPWEGMNRNIYKFNAKFDEYVYLPVVNVYTFFVPPFIRKGVSNFFNNFRELYTVTNSVFQLKGKKTAVTLGRIGLNTVFGIGGVIDVATPVGLPRQNEDFGQTLGHYGVGEGPYLVMPFLGPYNLRDAGGFAVDLAMYDLIDPFNFDTNKELGWYFWGLNAIDLRYQTEFRYFETGSPFEYELIRYFYTHSRRILVND